MSIHPGSIAEVEGRTEGGVEMRGCWRVGAASPGDGAAGAAGEMGVGSKGRVAD